MPMPTNALNLLELPHDVLTTAVLSTLDNSDLASLRLCAHELQGHVNAAVTELKPRSLAGDLAVFRQLRRLDLTGLRDEEWEEWQLEGLAKAGLTLTSLTLGRVQHLGLTGTEAIGRLAGLRTLELTEVPLPDSALRPLSRLTELQSLSLRDCSKLSDAGLQMLTHLKCLESLDLSMCWQLTDVTLGEIAGSLPRLKRLDLTGCERFTNAGLKQLCKARTLETLLMAACWQLNDECLETLGGGMRQLRCLGLFEAGEHITDEGLVKLSMLTNLTALDLGYSCWGHTAAGLKQLLGQLRGLQMLNVGGCEGSCDEVMEVVGKLTQLTMLDASECQPMTQRGVQHLAQLPGLLELSLGWNLKLSSFPSSPSITKLDLSFCGEMTDEALALTAGLPNLRSLALRKCTRVGDVGLRHLASSCPSLRRLDLSYCCLVTPEGLRHLATGLPLLESLVLVDCPRAATVLGMSALAAAKALRELDASDNKRLDDGCMQALSFLPHLRTLSVRACPKVSDHGLLALARITRLRDLNIDLCVAITPGAIARLQQRLPLLKRLRPSKAAAAAQLQASNARLV